jgi:hypothetical protein
MSPSRVDRILQDWDAIARSARRPASPPRRVVVRSALPGATFAGATVLVVAMLVAGIWFGRQGPNGVGGSTPSIPASPGASPAASASATPSPSLSRSPTVAVTPSPTVGPWCDPANLSARITMWEGAAGHRIAHVELRNTGSDPCLLEAVARPQLVDGNGDVLIDGSSPSSRDSDELAPGGVFTTLVQDGNYCGAPPAPPVSVAFVLSDGGRFVAEPASPTDATVPPCLGAAGSAGDIEMQPWTASS